MSGESDSGKYAQKGDPKVFAQLMATIPEGSAQERSPDAQAPPPPSFTGDAPALKIAGYRIMREISRGGQAVVFEATQLSTSRRVAIKVLRDGPFASAQGRARLEREVLVLAALDHPDIVQVFDKGVTADGSFFLVMPFLTGQPLNQYLDSYHEQHQGTSKDPAELIRLFLRICDAVNAAHLRGVIHRDLKPNNIQVDEDGNPRILDFGLARTALPTTSGEDHREVTINGEFLGSLPWASPEQADGASSKIDTRTDVYSLGVILYQTLTGQFPYEVVGTMRDVLNNILTAQPLPPSEVLAARGAREAARLRKVRSKHLPVVNPVMEAIVLKALSKRREDRYQTAGELARDIANYLAGRPTLAAGKRPPSLNRRYVAIGVGAAAAVLLGMVLVSVLRQRHNDLPPVQTNAPAPPVAQSSPPPSAPAAAPPIVPPAVAASIPSPPVPAAIGKGSVSAYASAIENIPGLLGYWRFSGSLLSEVNGYAATLQGGATMGSDQTGPALSDEQGNPALILPGRRLDGSGSMVRTSLNGQIADEGSIVCWFYLDSLPSGQNRKFQLAGESEFRNDFDLLIDTDDRIQFFTDNMEDVSFAVDPTPLKLSDLHTWIFVAGTFKAHGKRIMYVNGNEVAREIAHVHNLSGLAEFDIGDSRVFSGRFFAGRIDEVAVFQQELTPAQVLSIFKLARPVQR